MANILVVDDEPEIRSIMVDLLQYAGHHVTSADDGGRAFQCVQEQPFDLVVSDVMMPNVDGFELLQRIRSIAELASLPVILVTALGHRNMMRSGMNFGADDYLTKPFEPHELLNAVNAQLQKRTTIEASHKSELQELRNNITYALPHELLTPLNAILGYADIMIEGYETIGPDFILESGMALRSVGRRLHHLIENYLLYSRLQIVIQEPDHLEQIRQEITKDPSAMIELTVRAHAAIFRRENDLILDLKAPHLHMAEEALEHMVAELTDNAFRYSKPGTPVTVRTWMQGMTFRLDIEDKGRGLPTVALQRLGAFMQFERGHYEQQGVGLGLTLSKLLIEVYGGTLDIHTAEDQGTLLKIALRG